MILNCEPAPPDILIVDDNTDNLRVLTRVLKERGYKARQVTSGERALDVVRKRPPDLMLLDIQMPEMDGFEVCRHLKADAHTGSIPVIFITAQGDPESKVKGFKAGGSDYITKPFQVEEVLARVGYQLRIQTLTTDLARRNRQQEQILKALPVPYVISRFNGEVYALNDLAQDLFEVDQEDLSSINAEDFYKDQRERDGLIREIFEQGSVQGYEIQFTTRNGKNIWAMVSASIFDLDKGKGIFTGINDITARKKMEMDLEKMAMTDPLTGIHNRRGFINISGRQYMLAQRHKMHLALLLFDIDHFKKINDTYGHDVGDRALIHFVDIVKENLRQSDVFSRIGGEEFTLLLPDADPKGALKMAQRISEIVEGRPLEIRNEKIPMTVSGGLTQWKTDESLDRVLSRADSAMYQAKEKGRNQIVQV